MIDRRQQTADLTPVVVGVRHHSPACARLVASVIRRHRPRYVLVEGPVEMNGRLGELALPHELPVAVFTHAARGSERWASWSPFLAWSPEWVALEEAAAVGAEARFVDLPAWDPAFRPIRNRYADRHDRASRLVDRLCERLNVPDFDALWDHLFESPMSEDVLAERLGAYFVELRGDTPGDACDGPREAYMARHVAHAVRRAAGERADGEASGVVVVCGGYHAPVLARAWRDVPPEDDWPAVPVPDAERFGSSVVPYSYHRLDSFTGYEAGMPSPEYQDAVWRRGAAAAAEVMLAATAARLRRRKQPVSSADLVAARVHADALRLVRGHAAVLRVDLLDGLAAALVKDALDAPLPWSYRGRLRPRTDPLLVEVMATFSGERVGRLAEGTPLPALLADARAETARHGLQPGDAPRNVELRLARDEDLARSRVLHRLRLLEVPGFDRVEAADLAETWRIRRSLDADAALIEASAWGATLAEAAGRRLEEQLGLARGRIGPVSALVVDAARAGIPELARGALDAAAHAAAREGSLAELGEAMGRLLGLWRHDAVLGARGALPLGAVLAAAFDRALVLAEVARGVADPRQIEAVVHVRDTLRWAGPALQLDAGRAHGVAHRVADEPDAPAGLRGASLGLLWSTGFFPDDEEGATRAGDTLRALSRPRTLGDALGGLLATAREEVLHAPGLLRRLDELVEQMDEAGFLEALPALRLAFGWLPPREKEMLARTVSALRRGDAETAGAAPPAAVSAEVVARGRALQDAAWAELARLGLDGALEEIG